jgi:hypothetical protein
VLIFAQVDKDSSSFSGRADRQRIETCIRTKHITTARMKAITWLSVKMMQKSLPKHKQPQEKESDECSHGTSLYLNFRVFRQVIN